MTRDRRESHGSGARDCGCFNTCFSFVNEFIVLNLPLYFRVFNVLSCFFI